MGTKAADRQHAKSYQSPYGRWYLGGVQADTTATVDGDDIADAAPLRTVAAQQGAALRVAQGNLAPRTPRVAPAARAAARERAQAFVARNAQPRPPMATPVTTPASRAAQYAEADRAAGAVPAGRYALPRTNVTAAGNDITFFEVVEFKTGPRKGTHRIFQLVSVAGVLAQHRLEPKFQIYAARHIAEDVAAAATLYGTTIGVCAFGGHALTNKRSRDRGYGPDCAKRHGLPW